MRVGILKFTAICGLLLFGALSLNAQKKGAAKIETTVLEAATPEEMGMDSKNCREWMIL